MWQCVIMYSISCDIIGFVRKTQWDYNNNADGKKYHFYQ